MSYCKFLAYNFVNLASVLLSCVVVVYATYSGDRECGEKMIYTHVI